MIKLSRAHPRNSTLSAAILALWLALTAVAGCSDDKASGADTAAQADSAPANSDAAADATAQSDSQSSDAPKDSTPTQVQGKLALLGVAPAQGGISGGETVTLTGKGFSSNLVVLFGGTPLNADTVIVLDAETVQVTAPPHEAGLVDVQVLIPGDNPLSSQLDDAFLYFNELVIAAVTPPEGPVGGGTPITLSGSGFSGKTQVLVGGKPAIGVKVISDEEVIATTPPGVFGPQPVHVVNERGAGLLKNGFTYTGLPVITAVAPASGPTAGGATVTVSGFGFAKEAEVRFGGQLATFVELGKPIAGQPGFLKVVTPPGQGAVDVQVQTKHGSATLSGGYVYTSDQGQAATQILSIAPKTGPLSGGGALAVVATGLVAASDTTLLIGNKTAKILSVSAQDHVVMATVPKGAAAGAVDVVLMTSKGTSKVPGGYTYSNTLAIQGVSPGSGPPQGGTPLVIKGSGFQKGKPAVKVGALAAAAVTVVSDTEIQATTPPGSPGYVDVTVAIGAEAAVAKGAFVYTSSDLQLYVPYPASGAQAGGTLVHLYGSGFAASMEVRFADNPATHLTFIDSSHVTIKTPPGKVGAADVKVVVGKLQAVLPKGYTYFNPMSAYGGTWGSEVDGAINLTVLDAQSGEPVADAFAMLWTSPATPYQGFTNADGQITFSGEDVYGKQMVSASKTGYESASVVLFDASNVTLLLTPIPPPSSGSPPPPPPVPSVAGKVIGLDKYVFVPVGSCTEALASGPKGGQCGGCSQDSDCGGELSCIDIGEGNGKRCVASCGGGCGYDFKCYSFGGTAACAPTKGEITSVCYHSKPSFLSQDNYPNEGLKFEANAKTGYKYKIITAYGEMAIVCYGGYKTKGAALVAGDAESLQAFTPTVMGVKRHVMVVPDEKYETVDVPLNIPLTGKANLRLDNPPTWPSEDGYILVAGWAYLVLGGDGSIRLPDADQKMLAPFQDPEPDRLVINQLPAAMAGDIYDAHLAILGLDVQIATDPLTGQTSQVPVSITVKNDIKDLSNDGMVRRLAGGDLQLLKTGVNKNIYGVWGTAADNVYAVGAQGTLLHWNGGSWTLQASLGGGTADLRSVYGADATHVWAVGTAGAAAAFNGAVWKAIPMLSGTANFNGVFAATKSGGGYDVWAAAQQGLYRLVESGGQAGLQKFNPTPYGNYLGIHGSDAEHIWAVGMTGVIAHWNGQSWKQQTSTTSIALRSVWAASATSVFAVGEKGQILRYDGQVWKAMQSPTQQTLASVWGTSDKDVWAAGSRGALLHYDGVKWKVEKVAGLDKTLSAIWTSSGGDVFALGEQELVLGPILYPPLADMPKPNAVMVGNTLKWTVDPSTPEPHFNHVEIGIPGMGGDTPVWDIMTKGSLSQVDLPDFPSIQGTPGIPKGTPLRLTITRGYKEGFDIDHYDGMDLNPLAWRSWSMHTFMFTRQ
jgi:hypothetical protein